VTRLLVTGSSGHLGEALMRVLRADGEDVVGLDVAPGEFTDVVGSIGDRDVVREVMDGVGAVLHAATLHKPHVATRPWQAFVDVNVTGTVVLLEEAVAAGVSAFVFTSSTSAFGHAMRPGEGAPAAWVTEDLVPTPRNIYGVTKTSAENICELVHRDTGLPIVVLRTSRFFPEGDDAADRRDAFEDLNLKVNELLYRRVDIEDAVAAHRLAVERASDVGFGRFIVSATTPFVASDVEELRVDAPSVVARYVPEYVDAFAQRGWRMLPSLDRVYDNSHAREVLGWHPRWDFAYAVARLRAGEHPRSELTAVVGAKGYAGSSEAYAP
jgi:UDP-glucose 4-epimerase